MFEKIYNIVKEERQYQTEGRKASALKRQDPKRAVRTFKYYQVRNLSIKKGLSFDLSNDEFYELSMKDCHYCGSEPLGICYPAVKLFGRDSKTQYDYSRPCKYNGIDRVDNDKGYSKDNCVPCCKVCNYAKRSMTVMEFKNWIKRAYQHLFIGQLIL